MAAAASGQDITLTTALYNRGDDPAWAAPSFDDAHWQEVSLTDYVTRQAGFFEYGYAWYRMKVVIPSSLKASAPYKDAIVLSVKGIDDSDETFLNGTRVGKTGTMPSDWNGYTTAYNQPRGYLIPASLVRWDKENTIAIRLYNGADAGGVYGDGIHIGMAGLDELSGMQFRTEDNLCRLEMNASTSAGGTLEVEYLYPARNESSFISKAVRLRKGKTTVIDLPFSPGEQVVLKAVFTDSRTRSQVSKRYVPKYILTPAAPESPRYNGPLVFGARPGSPIIFRLAFSGQRPMEFSCEDLPEGLALENGILGGSIASAGEYKIRVKAENAHGTAAQEVTLRIGPSIALTPPMGWNSWNCWGTSVSQEKVISSAQAILDKGLADFGYNYINIDDAWEAPERNEDGTIATNEKFPDMKGLGDWLHSKGLRMGIYSSPGSHTCGLYLGSLGHEQQDASTWNEWGVDYLKYDWCLYGEEFERIKDYSLAGYVRPYMKMEECLRSQPRDIFYSLCQYGMASVWSWAPAVDANSWRTTGDITDTWESLYSIGFVSQKDLYPYSGPGHWNDPDMLIVGKVGWSAQLRDSRLSADEQYTHISLWALLAANMLIGCDVAQIDGFTLGLLCNNEVNAVNQDILGRQASCVLEEGGLQVWARPLADGSTAAGIFNTGSGDLAIEIDKVLQKAGYKVSALRDLWRQKDLGAEEMSCTLPSHGVRLVKF